MYHLIRFTADQWIDLERSPGQPLERVLVRSGFTCRGQLRPHILEAPTGPIEVADLFFENGTVTCDVPFAAFRFEEPSGHRP